MKSAISLFKNYIFMLSVLFAILLFFSLSTAESSGFWNYWIHHNPSGGNCCWNESIISSGTNISGKWRVDWAEEALSYSADCQDLVLAEFLCMDDITRHYGAAWAERYCPIVNSLAVPDECYMVTLERDLCLCPAGTVVPVHKNAKLYEWNVSM
jgi:hypothetical protein